MRVIFDALLPAGTIRTSRRESGSLRLKLEPRQLCTIRLGRLRTRFLPVMYLPQAVKRPPLRAFAVALPPVMAVCPRLESQARKTPPGLTRKRALNRIPLLMASSLAAGATLAA